MTLRVVSLHCSDCETFYSTSLDQASCSTDFSWRVFEKTCLGHRCASTPAEPDLRINAHESPDCCQPSVDEWELSQTKEMQ